MATISWTQTPTIYEMTLPSGNAYYLEDNEVRGWIGDGTTSGAEKRISTLETDVSKLANATHWLGVTSTTLTDGATTNPITINEQSVTAVNGDIVQDGNGTEYIFNGTAWQALGSSVGTLKAFAYADTGTVTISSTTESASVTFDTTTSGHTASVIKTLGTATVPKTSSSTKYLAASTTTRKLNKTSVPNVTSAGTASSWSFSVSSGVLTISGANGSAPTLGTAISVADGTVSTNGTGDSVATALSISSESSSGTGRIGYVESISESGTNDVTFGNHTTETVLTDDVTASVTIKKSDGTYTVNPST